MRVKTVVTAVVCLTSLAFGHGSLIPPGAPGETMKTLDEVEPRTPISSAAYIINSSGAYYLTTNLVPVGEATGIIISADDVTLDLNGFSILGAGANGQGIFMNDRDNVVVKNGTIRDCEYFGIAAFRTMRCQFKNLRVLNNGQNNSGYDGIHAGTNCTITGCVVMNNGSGIEVDAESKIVGNQIINNTSDGLKLNAGGSYVADNIVKGNADNYDLATGNQLNILLCEIPESLDWPCSVKLAGTLTCTGTGVNGITVAANDVTIDMDGHTLIGPGTSSGSGIYQVSTCSNLRIFNGMATRWQGTSRAGFRIYGNDCILSDIQASTNYYGIYAGNDGSISGCVASDNLSDGICVGIASTLLDCTARNNGDMGILTGHSCTISGCAAEGNESYGINAGHGSSISGCAAYENGGNGIYTGLGSSVSDCTACKNGGDGITASRNNIISGCVARENTDDGIVAGEGNTISVCTTSYNTGDGIEVSHDCRVANCTSDSNGYEGDGAGIHATSSDNRIDGNTVTDNDRGIDVDQRGNFIVRNTAAENTTQYDIVANNKVGEIVSAPDSAAISGSTGGSGVGSTSPWANFSF